MALASLVLSVQWAILIWPVALFTFGLGILLGGLIAGARGLWVWRAAWMAALALPILFAINQRLPISNLEGLAVGQIESVKLTGPASNSIEIDDPARLAQFASYARSGHQSVLWLSGFYCEAEIHFRGGAIERKIILGDCFGSQGGGHMQEVFVPEKHGLKAWVLASFEQSGVKFR